LEDGPPTVDTRHVFSEVQAPEGKNSRKSRSSVTEPPSLANIRKKILLAGVSAFAAAMIALYVPGCADKNKTGAETKSGPAGNGYSYKSDTGLLEEEFNGLDESFDELLGKGYDTTGENVTNDQAQRKEDAVENTANDL
jgi:hypothetical protein